MYEEIIRHLMKWEIVLMAFLALLFLVLPISVYVYILIRDRKKKKTKKNKWNNLTETPEEKALAFVIVGVLFFCVCFGISLYRYLSLREDMIAENYATYSGEFYYEETRPYRRGTSRNIYWKDENGEDYVITYDPTIDDYQPYALLFKEFGEGNYRGTVVYSPRSGYLLWWDAVPIGD